MAKYEVPPRPELDPEIQADIFKKAVSSGGHGYHPIEPGTPVIVGSDMEKPLYVGRVWSIDRHENSWGPPHTYSYQIEMPNGRIERQRHDYVHLPQDAAIAQRNMEAQVEALRRQIERVRLAQVLCERGQLMKTDPATLEKLRGKDELSRIL